MQVQFRRERNGGVQTAKVLVEAVPLTFKKDLAIRDLEEGVHSLDWLLIGPPGASLKVSVVPSDGDEPLVDVKLVHADGSQRSGSVDFRVKGAES
jgi:hypothetical protein